VGGDVTSLLFVSLLLWQGGVGLIVVVVCVCVFVAVVGGVDCHHFCHFCCCSMWGIVVIIVVVVFVAAVGWGCVVVSSFVLLLLWQGCLFVCCGSDVWKAVEVMFGKASQKVFQKVSGVSMFCSFLY